MREPREFAEAVEAATVPAGPFAEGFAGYGVMGLPFRSGQVLALRRFPANAVGDAYTSVWHRDPSGRWTFRQTAPGDRACSRYFGAALERTIRTEIELVWTGPRALEVRSEGLLWQLELAPTAVTRAMNAVARELPPRAWQSPAVLHLMGRVAGVVMRAARVGLQGTTPNGQRFQAHPLRVWMVARSTAVIDGQDLGPLGPLSEQTRLGGFWLPQRGVFAVGRSFFEGFDPERHLRIREVP